MSQNKPGFSTQDIMMMRMLNQGVPQVANNAADNPIQAGVNAFLQARQQKMMRNLLMAQVTLEREKEARLQSLRDGVQKVLVEKYNLDPRMAAIMATDEASIRQVQSQAHDDRTAATKRANEVFDKSQKDSAISVGAAILADPASTPFEKRAAMERMAPYVSEIQTQLAGDAIGLNRLENPTIQGDIMGLNQGARNPLGEARLNALGIKSPSFVDESNRLTALDTDKTSRSTNALTRGQNNMKLTGMSLLRQAANNEVDPASVLLPTALNFAGASGDLNDITQLSEKKPFKRIGDAQQSAGLTGPQQEGGMSINQGALNVAGDVAGRVFNAQPGQQPLNVLGLQLPQLNFSLPKTQVTDAQSFGQASNEVLGGTVGNIQNLLGTMGANAQTLMGIPGQIPAFLQGLQQGPQQQPQGGGTPLSIQLQDVNNRLQAVQQQKAMAQNLLNQNYNPMAVQTRMQGLNEFQPTLNDAYALQAENQRLMNLINSQPGF